MILRRLPAAVLAAGAMLLAAGPGAQAAPAPHVSIASLKQLPTPLPYPYDVDADAEAAVKAALARARVGHKRVLLDLGGNWCADCRILAAVLQLPEIAAFMKAHYEVVTVDVGRYDRNMQIPARYGLARLPGAPTVLVLDEHGRLINAGHESALTDARSMTPQALADWLASWTK
ncbi:thioredoxin family protein [Caulobacter sp. KR2-114]|uniref:thioredoxin family protein n=1 Tax=Caulobacter sp. KR2-114 TaxID=3400912 RepID=UPI003C055FC7